jgi:hypothetical protein
MVYNKQGFFELVTAEDLRDKARKDLSILRAAPIDSMAAFNFFVTARHVLEWKWGAVAATGFIVGDGAKHFELHSKRLTQVENLKMHSGAFDKEAFDSGAFDTAELQVELNPQEALAASLSERVDVVTLANAVMIQLDAAF